MTSRKAKNRKFYPNLFEISDDFRFFIFDLSIFSLQSKEIVSPIMKQIELGIAGSGAKMV
jgi:hypothetical protein